MVRFKTLKPKGIDIMANTTNKMTNKTAFSIALELVNQSNHPEKAEVAAKIAKALEKQGGQIRKTIVVKNKLVNLIVK